MGSLQDALLKNGLAEERQKPDRKGAGPGSGGRKQAPRNQHHKKKTGKRPTGAKPQASDLERAWRARRQAEKEEAERVKKARVADQEARRKRNLELDAIVEGNVLNVDEAELPRYFEHLGRIRRVLCTQQQRDAINSGELGIVNLRGRYLIVEPEVLAQYKALADDLVPDLGGAEPKGDDAEKDYPPVPDDLTW
ncbi:MAG TPA: DUF2058 family protein [Wenzhouxiangellaceae bacterium]|nr:DUF2058 family protein [Wenzhouxiangellaceae bacterium]